MNLINCQLSGEWIDYELLVVPVCAEAFGQLALL